MKLLYQVKENWFELLNWPTCENSQIFMQIFHQKSQNHANVVKMTQFNPDSKISISCSSC